MPRTRSAPEQKNLSAPQRNATLEQYLRFPHLLNSFPEPISITDVKGTFFLVNTAWEGLTGYTLKDIQGKNFSLLFSHQDIRKKRPQMLFQKAIEEGKAEEEYWRVRKDGSYFWGVITCCPLYTPKGRLAGFINITRDVTETKRLEAISLENERRVHEILQRIPLAVIMVDKEGVITYVNHYTFHIIGFGEEDLVGKRFLEFLTPVEARRYVARRRTVLKRGKGQDIFAIPVRTKSGEIRKIAWTTVVLHDALGNASGTLSMGEDITRREQLDEQRTAFLSVASHELRTPITTIQLLLDTIEKKYSTLFTKVNELRLLRREVERLNDLITEMLDISRVETGKLSMTFSKVDIDALIQEVIEKMQFMAGKRVIHYTSAKRCLVKGDAKRLEQVLTNLLTNAIKYSPDQSEVFVETKQRQSRIVVFVRDHGIGIPKNKVDHVFDRFYQVTSNGKQGFGLGLYICQQIMKQHHGSISVKSEFGKGSTFSISIPSAASAKKK